MAGIVAMGAVIVAMSLDRPPVVPESIAIVGNEVVAKANERIVWRHGLEPPDPNSAGAIWRISNPASFRGVDLNGDGSLEFPVILIVSRDNRFVRHELVCWSETGRVLWRYTPNLSPRFGEEVFAGPWRVLDWIVVNGATGPRIWVNINHDIWWPSFLVSLDQTGTATIRYVYPGHIYALAQGIAESGPFIVAAGINNEYASAMLTVLGEQAPPSTAPSSNPRFGCQGCPTGLPNRYLLFSRSELNGLVGSPYNRAYDIAVAGNRFDLSVEEGTAPQFRAVYRLSSLLLPESVAFGDAYWDLHRRLEREGRLDHSAQTCPVRRDGMTVRMWEPASGWTEEKVKGRFPVGLWARDSGLVAWGSGLWTLGRFSTVPQFSARTPWLAGDVVKSVPAPRSDSF